MRSVRICFLVGLVLLVSGVTVADERRKGGTDTQRHPSKASRTLTDRHPPKALRSDGDGQTRLERVDPAVRQYWSDRCVQQRARGWGQTGDCDSPAYTGGNARRDGRDRYRRHERRWPSGRRGPVIIERRGSDGGAVRRAYPSGRFSSGPPR